jgi:hypothetical protein
MKKRVPKKRVPKELFYPAPSRIKVFVNCADKKKNALLKVLVKKGLQIVDIVENRLDSNLVIIDTPEAVDKARTHVYHWFILVPEPGVKYVGLPANVWVIPMKNLLNLWQKAAFMVTLSEQIDLRKEFARGQKK